MAQDFHVLFPLNDNDKALNDADLHGVALAAIQGLNQKVEERDHALQQQLREKDAEIQQLQHNVAELKKMVLESTPAKSQ